MGWNIFSKKPQPDNTALEDEAKMKLRAMQQAIAEKRKDDPLIGPKVGAQDLVQRLLQAFKDERGVHIETVLSALGSLAGYACQAAIRSEYCEMKQMPESEVFVVAQTASGEKLFFGDLLNKPLAESQYSIWSFAAGTAQHLGAKNILKVEEIFAYVAETVGGDKFGIPRVPEKHTAGDKPINFVKSLWPKVLPIAKDYCETPSEWPVMFGLAIQYIMTMGKDVLNPEIALCIVMESAIPMSKVDLEAKI